MIYFCLKFGNLNKLSCIRYVTNSILKFSNSSDYQKTTNNTLYENKVFVDIEKIKF